MSENVRCAKCGVENVCPYEVPDSWLYGDLDRKTFGEQPARVSVGGVPQEGWTVSGYEEYGSYVCAECFAKYREATEMSDAEKNQADIEAEELLPCPTYKGTIICFDPETGKTLHAANCPAWLRPAVAAALRKAYEKGYQDGKSATLLNLCAEVAQLKTALEGLLVHCDLTSSNETDWERAVTKARKILIQ